MSALDDVIEWAKETQHEDITEAERAREELELLRDTSFRWASSKLHGQPYDDEHKIPGSQWCDECTSMFHAHECRVRSVLRTDPERAKRMGLGWAL